MLGTRRFSPCGGMRMSKPSSPTVRARASSFILSQARSLARMSMERVFATAPRPRGCSAPFTHTSNGKAWCVSLSTWPMKSANLPTGESIMYVHAGLPSGSSGRPGQRRLASTGSGSVLIDRRRFIVSTGSSAGAACAGFAGSVESTEPSTLLGR